MLSKIKRQLRQCLKISIFSITTEILLRWRLTTLSPQGEDAQQFWVPTEKTLNNFTDEVMGRPKKIRPDTNFLSL